MNDVLAALKAKGREIMSKTTTPTSFRDRIPGAPKAPAPETVSSTATASAEAMQAALRDDPRPYAGPHDPPRWHSAEIGVEILRRRGSPDIVQSDGPPLKKLFKKDGVLAEEERKLGAFGILELRGQAKARALAGKGRLGDAEILAPNGKNMLVETRKGIRRQRAALRQKMEPHLLAIARRFESHARAVLPDVEREASRLGLIPGSVPLVQQVALACWCPSLLVKTPDHPRLFLKRLAKVRL